MFNKNLWIYGILLPIIIISLVVGWTVWEDMDAAPEEKTSAEAVNYWDNDIKKQYPLLAVDEKAPVQNNASDDEKDFLDEISEDALLIQDNMGMLTPEDRQELEELGQWMLQEYGVSVSVRTIDSFGEDNPKDFAVHVFREEALWQNGVDNIMLIIGKNDKKDVIKVNDQINDSINYALMLDILHGMRTDMDGDNASYAIKGAYLRIAKQLMEENLEELPNEYETIVRDVTAKANGVTDDNVRITGMTEEEEWEENIYGAVCAIILIGVVIVIMTFFRMFFFKAVEFIWAIVICPIIDLFDGSSDKKKKATEAKEKSGKQTEN